MPLSPALCACAKIKCPLKLRAAARKPQGYAKVPTVSFRRWQRKNSRKEKITLALGAGHKRDKDKVHKLKVGWAMGQRRKKILMAVNRLNFVFQESQTGSNHNKPKHTSVIHCHNSTA